MPGVDHFFAADWITFIALRPRAASGLVGAAPDQLRGSSFLDIVEPRYHQEVRSTVPRLLSGQKDQVEFVRMKGPGGAPVYAEIRAAPLLLQGKKCLAVFLSEATERHAMQEQMRLSEEQFRVVFEESRDGLLAADPETRKFGMANQAICQMLGYGREELLGLGVEQIHPADALPEVVATFEAQVRGDFTLSPDLPVLCKDGSVFHAEINSKVVTVGSRQLMLGNFRDVTERRRMMASLAQADRMASLGLLAAGVAHEINNPLTYIIEGVDRMIRELPRLQTMLASSAGTDGAGARHVDDLLRTARETSAGLDQVRGIVRDLQRFSRVEEDTRGPVAVNEVLESAMSMTRNQLKYRARLVRKLGTVPAVRANEGRLSQVFLNLLVNAAHAFEDGAAQYNTVTVTSRLDGDSVVVEVADTGKGIPAEDLEKVFDPFYTTRQGGRGTGLGLSICATIVDNLGGEIQVHSKLGAGTVFTVRLPALSPKEKPRPARERRETPPDISPERPRVLVVDDEEPVAKAFKRMLSRQFDAEMLVSARDVVARLEAGERYDAIVCDLMMPDMTGMELHQWVADHFPAQADRMMFVTGGVFTRSAEEFLSSVNSTCLHKPISPGDLRQAVREVIWGTKPTS